MLSDREVYVASGFPLVRWTLSLPVCAMRVAVPPALGTLPSLKVPSRR
jgi:hypothetical protein